MVGHHLSSAVFALQCAATKALESSMVHIAAAASVLMGSSLSLITILSLELHVMTAAGPTPSRR